MNTEKQIYNYFFILPDYPGSTYNTGARWGSSA